MGPNIILKKLVDHYVANHGGRTPSDLWQQAIDTVYPKPAPERKPKPVKIAPKPAPYWWLGGTTCYRHTSVAWLCQENRFLLLKHNGHSEWCGGGLGTQYCEAYYCLYDMDEINLELKSHPGTVWSRSLHIYKWHGRWSITKQEKMERLCNQHR